MAERREIEIKGIYKSSQEDSEDKVGTEMERKSQRKRYIYQTTIRLPCLHPNLPALEAVVEEACLPGRAVGLAGSATESDSRKHSAAGARHIREAASVRHDRMDLAFGLGLAVEQTCGLEWHPQEGALVFFPFQHRKAFSHHLLVHALLMQHARVEL